MQARKIWRLIRFGITAGALFLVWLLFSSSFEAFSIISGVAGACFIAALTYDEFIASHEASLNSFMPRPVMFLGYLLLLIYHFYRASFIMLGAVFHGRVNPRIVHFRTRMKSDVGRMVLANSITFTPGTITLDLNDDHLIVHWFFCNTSHSGAAGEAVKGQLERQLRRVWQ